MSTNGLELINSVKHPAIKSARLLNTPSSRAERKEYLIEGRDTLRAAFDSPSEIKCAFFSDSDPSLRSRRGLGADDSRNLADKILASGVPCYRVSRGLLFKIIGTSYETAIDVVAVAARIPFSENEIPVRKDSLVVVGERIQDPRNVGVIVRTADAAGASVLILSHDSADPFCRAAVRSSTGSILHIPVLLSPNLPETLSRLKDKGARLISTSAHAKSMVWSADFDGQCSIVFGNETTGVSAGIRGLCDEEVSIPVFGSAHSLNVTVAAGIALYEWVRRGKDGKREGGKWER